ncbi:hypothetical protein B224_3365 [Aeromonas media WS]|nr:hypothetical protein B224_3365 [Aeromonas media WS]
MEFLSLCFKQKKSQNHRVYGVPVGKTAKMRQYTYIHKCM